MDVVANRSMATPSILFPLALFEEFWRHVTRQNPPELSPVQKLAENTTWKVIDKIKYFGGYGRGEFERCQ